MSRFMERQLSRAENKKLGRTTSEWKYDEKTGRGEVVLSRADAKNKPPLVVQGALPVGGRLGVVKPGSEGA